MTLHYAVFLALAILSLQTRVLGDELVLACDSTPDCVSIQEAVCLSNKCVCPGGSVLSSNMVTCLPVAGGFGAPCLDSVQCAVRMLTGAMCNSQSLCACAPGFHYLHGRCWRSAGLNEACTTSDQCYGNYNYETLSCNGSVCVCDSGFYLHGGATYCRREGKEIGDECIFDFDCTFEGGKCNSGKQCEGTTKIEGDEKKTMANIYKHDDEVDDIDEVHVKHYDAYLGETCRNDDECKAIDTNAVCNTGNTCWCSPGYYFFNNTRCAKELGESCKTEEDCNHIANSKCRINSGELEGSCSCTVQFTAGINNQICNRLRPGIEFNCQSQLETCQNFGPLCNCMVETSNICECLPISHFEEGPQTCWVTKGLYESCTDNRDCVTPSGSDGVDCLGGKCQCIDKYHDTDGDCRKDALVYGDACIDDVDCLFANPKCISKRCRCATGYFAQNNTAGTISCATGIGGKCTENDECSLVENSMCDTETEMCQCSSDSTSFVPSIMNDKCLPVAQQYEESCVEKAQCQAPFGNNSDCVEMQCVCNEGFHFRDRACWPMINLNDKCLHASECYLENDSERTECRNGFCECKYEFVESGDNTDCTSGGAMISLNTGVFSVVSIIALITSTL